MKETMLLAQGGLQNRSIDIGTIEVQQSLIGSVDIGRRHESRWRVTSLRISPFCPSKQKNMGLRFMDLVMGPSARLLHSEAAPFLYYQSVTPSLRSLPLGIFLKVSLGRIT